MSQGGPLGIQGSGPIPPEVATQYDTDDGNFAVPDLNILNVFGGTTTEDNPNGIETKSSGNTVFVDLTNRVSGSLTTTDATTQDLINFNLGAKSAYSIKGSVVGFIPATDSAASYFFEGTFKTDGTTATIVGGQFTSFQEDVQLQPVFVFVNTSGNNFLVEITGIAATTIDWYGLFDYIKVT